MREKNLKEPVVAEGGTGFLFWGLIFVTVLNMSMIIGALVAFAP